MNAEERFQARLALEGNLVFTDLRMERDALKEAVEEMLEALQRIVDLAGWDDRGFEIEEARAAIAKAKGVVK